MRRSPASPGLGLAWRRRRISPNPSFGLPLWAVGPALKVEPTQEFRYSVTPDDDVTTGASWRSLSTGGAVQELAQDVCVTGVAGCRLE